MISGTVTLPSDQFLTSKLDENRVGRQISRPKTSRLSDKSKGPLESSFLEELRSSTFDSSMEIKGSANAQPDTA
jgi:hypothetical protein